MSQFSNYTDLQASVLAFNWGRDTSYVADAIYLAHTRINRELRAPFMQKTTDLTISSYRIAVPSDFNSAERLWLDDSYDTPLEVMSPERIAYWRATYSSGQRPAYYAIEGDTDGEYFVFAPDPGATTYTGKLLYNRRLTAFSSGSDTNVVLTRHPMLYLYGALTELARFSDEQDREARFAALFETELARINTRAQFDGYAGGPLVPTSPYVVP